MKLRHATPASPILRAILTDAALTYEGQKEEMIAEVSAHAAEFGIGPDQIKFLNGRWVKPYAHDLNVGLIELPNENAGNTEAKIYEIFFDVGKNVSAERYRVVHCEGEGTMTYARIVNGHVLAAQKHDVSMVYRREEDESETFEAA